MRFIVMITGLLFIAVPSQAQSLTEDIKAQRDKLKTDAMRLDVMGVVGMSTVGGAGWLVVPVGNDGLVDGVDDSFDIEVGGYLAWHSGGDGYISVVPTLGAKWGFQVSNVLTTFVTGRLGLEVGIAEDVLDLTGGGSLGTYWHVGEGVDLRFEVGYPYFGMLGVSLPF